jgi:hypothetical protein
MKLLHFGYSGNAIGMLVVSSVAKPPDVVLLDTAGRITLD